MFVSSMVKLLIAIAKKKELTAMNLIAKLSMAQDYYLLGDILDRFCPGNSKKIKSFCFHRFQHSTNISLPLLIAFQKLFLEDMPQAVIQCIYVFLVAEYGKSGKPSSNWIILVNISKNLLSVLASFYGSVSVRPSYLEQADFDELMNVGELEKVEKKKVRRKSNLLAKEFVSKNSEVENIQETLKKKNDYNIIWSPVDIEKGN